MAASATRLLSIIRYYAALVGGSHRYLPPLVAYLAVLALVYTDHRAPVAPELAVSAGALLVVTCWLTISTVGAEDPVQRLVTISRAGGRGLVLGGLVGAVLACAVAALAGTLGWAFVLHGPADVTASLPAGIAVHLAAACAGVAVGLPCSRLLLPHIGYTLVAALLAVGAVLLVPWLPLLNPALRSLGGNDPGPGPALLCLAVSTAVLAASAGGTSALAHRR